MDGSSARTSGFQTVSNMNLEKAIQQIIWTPQPQQAALISCPCFEVFFGGARGGGKTDASIGDWIEHSNTYGEHAIGIFVRRKLKQLEEVIARTQQLFTKIGATYNVQQKNLDNGEWSAAEVRVS